VRFFKVSLLKVWQPCLVVIGCHVLVILRSLFTTLHNDEEEHRHTGSNGEVKHLLLITELFLKEGLSAHILERIVPLMLFPVPVLLLVELFLLLHLLRELLTTILHVLIGLLRLLSNKLLKALGRFLELLTGRSLSEVLGLL